MRCSSQDGIVSRAVACAALFCVCSFLLANLELQIEGKDGWAKNLPTWRLKTALCRGGTPLTGYHIGLWSTMTAIFVVVVFLPSMLWGVCSDISFLTATLTHLGLFLAVEDAMWFALNYRNPENHFGLAKQLLGYAASGVAVLCGWFITCALRSEPAPTAVWAFLAQLGVCITFVLAARLFRPVYRWSDLALHNQSAATVTVSNTPAIVIPRVQGVKGVRGDFCGARSV